jgi:phosphoserine phosphatase
MHWTVATGLLSREATDWLDARYRGYNRGEVSELAICGEMVQVYQGLREEEMRSAAAKFFAEKIERNIFPEMLALVTELQRRGCDIWAVSSTNDWVIEEGVRSSSVNGGPISRWGSSGSSQAARSNPARPPKMPWRVNY